MDVSYAAGFFDGEGSIAVIQNRTRGEKIKRGIPGKIYLKYSLVVAISNTAKDVLDSFSQKWGGNVYQQKKTTKQAKQCFVWRLNGKHAKPFLEDVFPFLRVKHEHVALALEFINMPRGWNPEKRARIAKDLRLLNGYHWRKHPNGELVYQNEITMQKRRKHAERTVIPFETTGTG